MQILKVANISFGLSEAYMRIKNNPNKFYHTLTPDEKDDVLFDMLQKAQAERKVIVGNQQKLLKYMISGFEALKWDSEDLRIGDIEDAFKNASLKNLNLKDN